jgi:hypothetical protein
MGQRTQYLPNPTSQPGSSLPWVADDGGYEREAKPLY